MAIGETEFAHFFPFHKPALEVLRAVTYELTTTRSAIHFMHQTLKHQIKVKGQELVRLWELFDEAVRYEEDPSGVHAGITSIKTKREAEYRAYEACKRQIEAVTSGAPQDLARDRAVKKTIQTLFLLPRSQNSPTGSQSGRDRQLRADRAATGLHLLHQGREHPALRICLRRTLRKQEFAQVAQSFDEDGEAALSLRASRRRD